MNNGKITFYIGISSKKNYDKDLNLAVYTLGLYQIFHSTHCIEGSLYIQRYTLSKEEYMRLYSSFRANDPNLLKELVYMLYNDAPYKLCMN